ncbi:MAG: tetratricopeptide repeat protein [Anaerolineales bacterium]|nr:tetratricopeptide repeat protein [Anaerolineales bacterium]
MASDDEMNKVMNANLLQAYKQVKMELSKVMGASMYDNDEEKLTIVMITAESLNQLFNSDRQITVNQMFEGSQQSIDLLEERLGPYTSWSNSNRASFGSSLALFYYLKGQSLMMVGRKEQASEAFRKAAKIPEHPNCLLMLKMYSGATDAESRPVKGPAAKSDVPERVTRSASNLSAEPEVLKEPDQNKRTVQSTNIASVFLIFIVASCGLSVLFGLLVVDETRLIGLVLAAPALAGIIMLLQKAFPKKGRKLYDSPADH